MRSVMLVSKQADYCYRHYIANVATVLLLLMLSPWSVTLLTRFKRSEPQKLAPLKGATITIIVATILGPSS